MNEEPSNNYVVVSSPMRTGSTWLVSMLRELIQIEDLLEASSLEAVNEIVLSDRLGGIIKTHELIDLDWPSLPPSLPVLRVTRNYKDSIISRVLYAMHIRPNEGRLVGEVELVELGRSLPRALPGELVNAFVESCPLLIRWLAEIVVLERGTDLNCISVSYEELMRNPYDALEDIAKKLWSDRFDRDSVHEVVRASIGRGYRDRESFLRRNAIGVGGWETWLTHDQAIMIDDLYFSIRSIADSNRSLRAFEIAALACEGQCELPVVGVIAKKWHEVKR